jgi:hypothetical protein
MENSQANSAYDSKAVSTIHPDEGNNGTVGVGAFYENITPEPKSDTVYKSFV